jgi:putative restriction endonuclease
MTNYAYQNRNQLSEGNYVRIASPNTDYWVDFSYGKLDELIKSGREFYLVIIGDKEKAGDFYAIPFSVVSHLFSPTALYQAPKKRWIASVTHHQLRVRNAPSVADVGAFYGAIYLLDSTRPGIPKEQISEQEQNEYAIENRRMEIKARQKQSVFRASVLANFEGKCCISEINETDMLVAGHIVPWADKIESRLDPANGLCLFVSYDKLFDLGYISLDDDLRIITVDSDELSSELRSILQNLNRKAITKPVKIPINPEYIRYHRSHIFRG